MKQGKYANHAAKRNMKPVALVLALVLLVGAAVGGTVAWLMDDSDVIVNTFTTSDITVELKETTGREYQMIPGYTITKDPKVTVKTGSEDCIVFVKLDKSANFDSYMEYTMADGWKELQTGVYYRTVEEEGMGIAMSVLKGDQVEVKGEVTKEMMNDLTTETYPTLTITAYAHQLHRNADEDFDAADAWKSLNPSTPTP